MLVWQVREHKILEHVINLQAFFRMLQDYVKYRTYRRAIQRLQGFCKSWEIRRAYMEVRSAAKVFQKHARSYLAHQKLLDMKESEDPALTKEKKKEEKLKILYPERFGRGKMNLSGKRRPMRLQLWRSSLVRRSPEARHSSLYALRR